MKKIIVSIVAVIALAACSKSEVQYDGQSEISFAPVAKLSTKAAVNDVAGTDPTDYPDGLNMYVFANAGAADADLPAGYTEPYFANAEFTHGNAHNTNVFGGVTPYYWPNVKKLIFSGYSKSGNVASMTTKPTYTWNATASTWEINMTGYQPGEGTAALGDNDLMWFPTTAASYGKQTNAIPVTMQHACSWITINIKGDATTGAATTTWKILDLTIADLAQTGNVVLGAEATWKDHAAGTSFDVYEGTGKELTSAYVDYTRLTYQDLIVIPQMPKTLKVKYSYVSQPGGGADGKDIVVTEEKDVPLTYTGDQGWKPGVHYTYNLTIGTSEILIEPSVKKWDVTSADVNVQ